ncbi:hypothetical protein TOPH_03714 [Tolypocladium ophioglossoides CBS 100239]|uniref:Uncharacterized protein n=1 Tax=Tolypocladium ophioglossoides (strain CBS 100239) TaxID=1163406 RepID=A0A0L0NBK6_TOLOC|nr:hypothetical protein TOPH_03714 [Tolypocladium ophioglossoides CBS 100239]
MRKIRFVEYEMALNDAGTDSDGSRRTGHSWTALAIICPRSAVDVRTRRGRSAPSAGWMQHREWEPGCAPSSSTKDKRSSAGDVEGRALLFGDGVQLWRFFVDSAIDPEPRAEKRRTGEDGELSQLEGLMGIRRVDEARRGDARRGGW